MNKYIVNTNATYNPGYHHEVHTIDHARELRISSWIDLGYFFTERDAVRSAQNYYADADGCAVCCPDAHRG